jgi:gamma-glutamyl-gamma-aminobutyraldehyde dehydrogenase
MPGDPLDPASRAGAVVSAEHMDRVLSAIDAGRQEGAEIVAGGGRVHEETGGYFIAPTIFSGVHPQSRLAQNEIFGPVLSVLTFDGLDDALRLANNTIYGLGASIWSADTSRALQFARRLQAGVVYVNCFDADDITTPFGGVKQSGQGRDKSLHALEKYMDLKSVWVQLGEPMRAAPPGDV